MMPAARMDNVLGDRNPVCAYLGMENYALIPTRKLLFDVLDSGRDIRQWCSGRGYKDYLADGQLRRAVGREFEVIGEALNRLSQEDAGMDAYQS